MGRVESVKITMSTNNCITEQTIACNQCLYDGNCPSRNDPQADIDSFTLTECSTVYIIAKREVVQYKANGIPQIAISIKKDSADDSCADNQVTVDIAPDWTLRGMLAQ